MTPKRFSPKDDIEWISNIMIELADYKEKAKNKSFVIPSFLGLALDALDQAKEYMVDYACYGGNNESV